MSEKSPIRQIIDLFGLHDIAAELDAEFAAQGGIEGVLSGNVPPTPPPQPNPALGIPDPPLAAGVVRYAVADERGGETRPISPLGVETTSVSAAGGPAWRVAMTMSEQGTPVQWEAVMRAADLRPLAYLTEFSLLRFEGTAVGEWLYVSSDLARKHGGGTSRRRIPEWAFVSPASLWAALAAAPLERGWSASVHLLHRTPPHESAFVPLRMEVVGEERLRTAIGEVDCWIVTAEGSLDANTVSARIWVSRGEPARRAVVRVLERREGGTRTRRYEIESMRRDGDDASRGQRAEPRAAPPAPPAPDAPFSVEISVARPDAGSIESVRLKRGRTGHTSPEQKREIVERGLERVPPLELLRARGEVGPHTPAAAIARYERERADYAADMLAYLELVEARQDVLNRTIVVQLRVGPRAGPKRPTYLRLVVPPGVVALPQGESYPLDQPHPPVPVTAPLEKSRKRLVRRLVVVRERYEGLVPSERFEGPDGSTVVVLGPAEASLDDPAFFRVSFEFPTWEQVAPFTVEYDVSAEGADPMHGTFRVGAVLDAS